MIPPLDALAFPDPTRAGPATRGSLISGSVPRGKALPPVCLLKSVLESPPYFYFDGKHKEKPFENSILKDAFGKCANLEPEEGPGTRFWFSRNSWVLKETSNAII